MENFLKIMIFILLITIIWVKIANNTNTNLPTQDDFDRVNQVLLVNRMEELGL